MKYYFTVYNINKKVATKSANDELQKKHPFAFKRTDIFIFDAKTLESLISAPLTCLEAGTGRNFAADDDILF